MKPPIEISGYEFVAVLKGGDLAQEVWKARRAADGRWAIVKILPEVDADNATASERFLVEAHRLQTLRHPALIPVLDAGVKQGHPFYVAEFIEADSLRDLIERRGPLSESDALTVARGVAAALAFAWDEAGLFHGHLSPGNVLIDRQDVVRVADLGLGRLVRSIVASAPEKGACRHRAPHYAAPEQGLPNAAVDFRADIYALGMLLYHLLTGTTPFGDSSDAEALNRHATGFLDDPRKLRPQISEACVRLLENFTVKDPARRPNSWAAALADLDSALEGRPPSAAPPAPGAATIRCEARSASVSPAETAPLKPAAPPPVFDRSGLPAAAARQRVVVSPQLHRELSRLRRRRRSKSGLSLGLLFALSAAAAVYWYALRPQFQAAAPPETPSSENGGTDADGYRRVGRRNAEGALLRETNGAAPTGPRTSPSSSAPRAEPLRFEMAPTPPEDAPESPRPNEPRSRQHPDFVAGGRAFNEALALFKQYEKDRNAAALPRIERLAQTATERFEAYARAHPEDPVGKKYVEQAYGLVRYARQLMLMKGGDAPRERSPIRRAPDRPSAPPSGAPPARGLRLGPGWNMASRSEGPAAQELWKLLSPRGSPAISLAADPNISIAEGVPYLTPARTAAARWKIELPAPEEFRHPALPDRSFKLYALTREIISPWPQARLLTDTEDGVAALQLLDDRPLERPTLPAALFADSWTVYDLLTAKTRDRDDRRIAHRVRVSDRLVRIDSELVEINPAQPDILGRSLYRSSLLLPQPIADLMIHRLYTGRGAPSG